MLLRVPAVLFISIIDERIKVDLNRGLTGELTAINSMSFYITTR